MATEFYYSDVDEEKGLITFYYSDFTEEENLTSEVTLTRKNEIHQVIVRGKPEQHKRIFDEITEDAIPRLKDKRQRHDSRGFFGPT